MELDYFDEETFRNVLKPIYPSKKENWMKAYYTGLRPYTIQKFKSKELLKIYVFSDIEWYVSEHNYYPLVTTFEHHSNFLRITDEEYKEAIDSLIEEDCILCKQLDDEFVVLYPKY